jgi:hypothetical protein
MGILRVGGARSVACATVLWVQTPGEVSVAYDPQSRETTYAAESGACRVSWIVSGFEINRGVVRHRSQCNLPLLEQIPVIAKVMERVLADSSSRRTPRTLFWGRLYPDEPHDSVLAMRLAVAAKQSAQWDASRGGARTGNENDLVRGLANDALIYAELREMFRNRGLDIQVAAVEKVLVLPAGQLPFFNQLPKSEIKATDKLPYDCMT